MHTSSLSLPHPSSASPACLRLTDILRHHSPPPDTFRNQTKTGNNDRTKGPGGEGLVLNQENRRPVMDRNGTRGSASTLFPTAHWSPIRLPCRTATDLTRSRRHHTWPAAGQFRVCYLGAQ